MTRRLIGFALVLVLVVTACSESEPDSTAAGGDTTTSAVDAPTTTAPASASTTSPSETVETSATSTSAAAPVDDGSVVATYAGEEWFLGTVPSSATPADTSLEPITIGMINQENTPLGSFPEMRGAAEAATAWVNAELGGVGGRPIEIVSCITSFNVEQSQACAQDMVQAGVVALVGGIDVTSNGAIPVLAENGLPVVGGIPANLAEQRSPVNFFFSGGGAGAMAAFMAHAAENGASKAMIAYGEFESFEVAARDYGAAVGESLGLDVELVTFPITSTDMLPILTAAADSDVDALVVAAADSACVPVMQGAVQLQLRAQVYLTGACAADPIVEAAGDAAATVVYNSEGPNDPDDVEGEIYQAVVDEYATEAAGGAGTVGFRGFMNLYALLVELGPDNISSESITDLVSSAVERPSFWGHPYTCDGERVPGLPSLCAPEQTLFGVTGPGGEIIDISGGFIETDELFQAALG